MRITQLTELLHEIPKEHRIHIDANLHKEEPIADCEIPEDTLDMLSGHVAQLAAYHQFPQCSTQHHGQTTEEIHARGNGHEEEPAPKANEDLLVEYIERQDA